MGHRWGPDPNVSWPAMTDAPSPDTTDSEGLAEALEGDPSATAGYEGVLEGLGDAAGTLGTRDTRELGDLASAVVDIGRASHTAFGDRIAHVGTMLADLAREARRRLAEDRLPPGTGTPEQRARRDDVADDLVPPA